ncbi:2'-5' RNA ligase [Peptoclostridium litorale DSM 5388]|uniref:RNA 2',3'-cyclic phosphodiesterase n=1 Tax=Peptoclostridium litorale DSM 5388 TaxID=1121324 RepID=A0A069RI00_PEPLI|nr:RNA 2',3'-cyclic phosphodiesterase [Peptoclostridium litorale]KDR96639.1 hypothetical protein CLIT_2c02450 [Peptoclostridium litorale DSM 5388]SIN68186.1 2'-5' RNA ligase [Peptoclostridium litorale DSM 5388]
MRLFIAACPPEEILYYIYSVQNNLISKGIKGNYAKPRNIHMTIKFLGETDESDIPKLVSILENYRHLDIEFKLDGISWFKRRGRLILFIDLAGDVERLELAVNEIEDKFERMGFEREKKKFYPHMTIARKVNLSEANINKILHTKIKPIHFKLEEFNLVKSTLTDEGPIYEILY